MFLDYFSDENNLIIVARLKQAGLIFEIVEEEGTTSNVLADKTFVVSGVFEKIFKK